MITATANGRNSVPAGPPAARAAIRTEDLRKTYKSSRGDVEAVRGIDLDIPQGEFFGLLGPNGAGKSTTIGMLTTLVHPTGGRAWVAGHTAPGPGSGTRRPPPPGPPSRARPVRVRRELGVELLMPAQLGFQTELPAAERSDRKWWQQPPGSQPLPF